MKAASSSPFLQLWGDSLDPEGCASAPEDLSLRDSGRNGCPARGHQSPSRLERCCEGCQPSRCLRVTWGQASIASLAPQGWLPTHTGWHGPAGMPGVSAGSNGPCVHRDTLLLTRDSGFPTRHPARPSDLFPGGEALLGLCDVVTPTTALCLTRVPGPGLGAPRSPGIS